MATSPQNSKYMRSAAEVMELERLGSAHAYRLSFMRVLMRRVMNERWKISKRRFDLDDDGLGCAVYEIDTRRERFSFVVFAHELDPESRSDRVIAERWDMTVTLCAGRVSDEYLEHLRRNVPLQENGRMDSRSIVLSRANKSVRNFGYVVDQLAAGQQPDPRQLLKVGYLYRTTAVYGSGKFGMADWKKVCESHPDFNRPFAAEMFSCFMIRQFSLDQAEHIAACRDANAAVKLERSLQRYFGIGNATGLGMAPYLINHPILIDRWVQVRESAVARIISECPVTATCRKKLCAMLSRASQHFSEIVIDDEDQTARNQVICSELEDLGCWLAEHAIESWTALCEFTNDQLCFESQEITRSLLTELYPDIVDPMEADLIVDEHYTCDASDPLTDFRTTIENHYAWALQMDLGAADAQSVFWYRSREKMEPRLGEVACDPGEDRSLPMMVARDVKHCYEAVIELVEQRPNGIVADLLLHNPNLRSTVRRIQTLAALEFGDIHANLGAQDVRPMHLLRCKLSFFGVSKFDPRSRLWVRNTMFQGAPVVADIGADYADDWYFPCLPSPQEQVH